MDVKVLFFGVIADVVSQNEVSLSNVSDTDALKEALLHEYPEIAKYKYLLSVNHAIVTDRISLKDNDEVALLPPFAGG
ncbi:MoaD/ThiS family protein [Bacteroidota bacterium]